MEKIMLHFEPDEWLVQDIENYKRQHPELEFNKDILQAFIIHLKERVSSLEAFERYVNETAEKSASGPPSTQSYDSPSEIELQKPTQKPRDIEIIPPTPDEQTVQIGDKSYIVAYTQTAKAVWYNGRWTFSRKEIEALAFAHELLELKNQKTRELMVIKADGQRAIEQIKTEGAQARRRGGSQRPGQWDIETKYAQPIDDGVV